MSIPSSSLDQSSIDEIIKTECPTNARSLRDRAKRLIDIAEYMEKKQNEQSTWH